MDYRFDAKLNQDGSYSTSIPIGALLKIGFVDYYDERTGTGLQRYERSTPSRGRKVTRYIRRSQGMGVRPHLFELTANIRVAPSTDPALFDAYPGSDSLGNLVVSVNNGDQVLSLVDGGTRFLGLRYAVEEGLINESYMVDVRVFVGLSIAEEIALFLLINLEQKKVRTDLSLRLVQRMLDNHELSESETALLHAAVPEQDAWKYRASRITARLNTDQDSPWNGLIQMPSDLETKPLKMQAMFSSLRPLLINQSLTEALSSLEEREGMGDGELLIRILKNFWNAVAAVNPKAKAEPRTTVLWGSIGASASHIVLAKLLGTEITRQAVNIKVDRFVEVMKETVLADYEFWFTSSASGSRKEDQYPEDKGDATTYTGAAGYSRLAGELEEALSANFYRKADTAKLIM